MVKHALNSYLATSITFTNEIASICEAVSADMSEVETALRLDPRIGPRAYVRAGAAFGGGTLARDVQFLKSIADGQRLKIPVLSAVLDSNSHHKKWALRHLIGRMGTLTSKKIGVLGLAYKAGTGAIRRSVAIEIIQDLLADGAHVVAFDPQVRALPEPLASKIELAGSADLVFNDSDAVILATEWPEFRKLDFASLAGAMRNPILIDQNAFVAKEIASMPNASYIVAGRVS